MPGPGPAFPLYIVVYVYRLYTAVAFLIQDGHQVQQYMGIQTAAIGYKKTFTTWQGLQEG